MFKFYEFCLVILSMVFVFKFTPSKAQESAGALHFDGNDDFINGFASSVDGIIFTEGTIEAWLKPGDLSYNASYFAIRTGGSGLTRFSLHINPSTNQIGFFNGSVFDTFTVDSGINPDVWNYITVVIESNQVKAYFNGELIDTITDLTLSSDYSSIVNIGRSGDSNGQEYYQGEMDELRVWDIALDDEKISQNYQCKPTGDEDNLELYFDFNDQAIANEANSQSTVINKANTDENLSLVNFSQNGTTSNWVEDPGLVLENCYNEPAGALDFDGVDDYVIGEVIDFPEIFSEETTVEAWLKPADIDYNSSYFSIRSDFWTRYSLHINPSTNQIGFFNGSVFETFLVPENITPDEWIHVSIVFKQDSTEVYVNGGFIGDSEETMNQTLDEQFFDFFNIGFSGNDPEYYEGEIDELRVWGNALNAADIANNYLCKLTGEEENLALYTDFNNENALALADNSDENTLENLTGNQSLTLSNFNLNGEESNWVEDSDLVENCQGTGEVAGSLHFDGVDDYISGNVSDVEGLNFEEGVVEFWFKPEQVNYDASIINFSGGSFNDTLFGVFYNPENSAFTITDGINSYDTYVEMEANEWTHVAVKFNSENTTLFINGESKFTTISLLPSSFIAGQLYIGVVGNSFDTQPYKGQIDEIRVWNTPLSDEEITKKRYCKPDVNDENLALYLDFDNDDAFAEGLNSTQTSITNGVDENDILELYNFELTGETSNWTEDSNRSYENCINPGALNFDGVNDNAVVGNITEYSTSTFEAWIQPAPQDVDMFIFGKKLGFYVNPIQDKMGVLTRSSNGTISNKQYIDYEFTPDEWVHIAYVHSVSGVEFYVNGEHVGSIGSYDASSSNFVPQYFIGGVYGAMFKGSLDQLRFWNTALSAQDILDIYQCEIDSSSDVPSNLSNNLIFNYNFNSADALVGVNNNEIPNSDQVKSSEPASITESLALNSFDLNGETSNWVEQNPQSSQDCSSSNLLVSPSFTREEDFCQSLGDTKIWTFESTNGEPILAEFDQGVLSNSSGSHSLKIYDGENSEADVIFDNSETEIDNLNEKFFFASSGYMHIVFEANENNGPLCYSGYQGLYFDVRIFDDYIYLNNEEEWFPAEFDIEPEQSIYVYEGEADLTSSVEAENLYLNTDSKLNINATLKVNNLISNSGQITFKSNQNSTGQLDEFTGSYSGNEIQVERYFPANRSFRFVTSAVDSDASIYNNWQEDGETLTGYGTHITGSTEGANGFDATETGNASLFEYDNSTQSWSAVENTNNTNLEAGKPYRLYVRGDRTIDLTDNEAQGETVLRATGDLVIGDVVADGLGETADDFSFIANPYQASIDMSNLIYNNISSSFYWVWDPNMNEDGAYVVVDISDGSSAGSSEANQFLQPGQAAFVGTLADGPASVTFTEASKNVDEVSNAVFSDNNEPRLNLRLYETQTLQNGGMEFDAIGIRFKSNGNNAVDSQDAPKMGNPAENLARLHGDDFLTIENRELPQDGEELSLALYNYEHINYTFEADLSDFSENVTVYLNDNYTGEQTVLENGLNHVDFSVDSSIPESVSMTRFSISFEVTTLGVTDEFASAFSVYPNPVTNQEFTIQASHLAGQDVDLKLFNISGQAVMTQNLKVNGYGALNVETSQLSSGVYILELTQGKQSYKEKLIIK